jgi:polysaccharide biosynthesis transport protein
MTDIASMGAIPVGEYVAIFRRQRWPMLLVGIAILTAVAALVTYWPATYRSTATILISRIDTAVDLVRSTASSSAEERVRAIQQRITTTQSLSAIIKKLDLYVTERRSLALTQIVDKMRSNIGLSIVSADPTSRGRDGKAAIAFTLWFDADNPRTAQRVTNELVTHYLAENDRDREGRAAVAAGFLKAESLRLQQSVQALEGAIERFKSGHAGYLPEDRTSNNQLLDRIENQISDLTREARSLRERQGLFQAQLAKTPRYLPPSGDIANPSLDTQLALLEGKLAAMRAKYGDGHPDVLALDRQILALKSAGATSPINGAALAAQVHSITTDLEAARRQYGAKHPDVTRLERELRIMRARLAAAPTPATATTGVGNPDYENLQIQLASVKAELAVITSQLTAAEEKRSKIEQRILKAPAVEREYVGLRRDYEVTLQRYLEVRSKHAEAELASDLEAQRVGQTLSVAEPPVEPVDPIKPNRRIIIAIGLAAALAGAGVTAVLFDALDGRIHGWRHVTTISGQTPFAVIPVIRTASDRRRIRMSIAGFFLLSVLMSAVVLAYIHDVLLPLGNLVALLEFPWGTAVGAPSVMP